MCCNLYVHHLTTIQMACSDLVLVAAALADWHMPQGMFHNMQVLVETLDRHLQEENIIAITHCQ